MLDHGEGGGGATHDSLARIFQEANLERLLQAIASEPGLVSEMRLLLGPAAGAAFQRFCDDLESVVATVQAEVAS